ncbi:MAG: DUF2059 domain-containing protein, partial [Burkholderiales bacterium]|nr:DUF2059 domain-containing protein [Burkholderiales bacterium]
MFRSVIAMFVMSLAASANAQATISPAKEQLINRILLSWHVENIGITMLQDPVNESLRQSRSLLQGRTSAEKQEATMKEIAEFAKE